MCSSKSGDSYYDITPEQEKKLEGLIVSKKIPKTFKLNGQTVISEDILGFTNDKPKEKLNIKTWEEFRDWAYQQSWYLKNQPKSQPVLAKNLPLL